MKFCLNCGEEVFLVTTRKLFCCTQCRAEYQRKKTFLGDKVHTIENSFQFFKTIERVGKVQE